EIIQPYLPWLSLNWFSTFLIGCVSALQLCGLSWVQRFAIPLAAIAALLCTLTVLIPVFSGQVDWTQSFNHTLIAPFPNQFGQISGVMAALYIIGWLVPGYESTLCYVGETIDPQRNVKRAMLVSMLFAGHYYGIAPTIWLNTIGPSSIARDLTE